MSIFSKIKVYNPPYSTFDLSYDYKLSFKMGYLIPVHVQECVPGDKFWGTSEAMFRMMPMLAPIMHRVDVYMHFFFVPNRLTWPNWEKYITGGEDPDVGVPAFPTIDFANQPGSAIIDTSTLGDYLGLPTGVSMDAADGVDPVSALPFAAYQRIWQEWYRDQNLVAEDLFDLQDGVQDATNTAKLVGLKKRAWEHDYFTACLPWAQKGDAINMPLDLVSKNPTQGGLSAVITEPNPPSYPQFVDQSGNPIANQDLMTGVAGDLIAGGTNGFIEPNGSMGIDPADLTGLTTINDLRTAEALQKWLELNARGGTRYTESIFAHFGVKSPDQRLQRPEYLGGSKANMAISEVLQTSETDTTAQGSMAGHGISVSGGKSFSYYCQEHGYIMGLLSVRPKTAYMQGIPRHFLKTNDRTEFYWPMFAQLGEQSVFNKELYIKSGDLDYNNGTFGYIPRFSEYRYNMSRVGGQMRDTLEYWHMARKFATPPALNASFVEANPDKRIFAVLSPDDDEIVAHIYHKIIAKRPLPYYATPSLV